MSGPGQRVRALNRNGGCLDGDSSRSEPKLEHMGYHRGLTMAESMLLLVFCLLLVAAAMITAERKRRMAAEQRLVQLETQNKELSAQLVEAQSKLGSHMTPTDRAKFESEWRELGVRSPDHRQAQDE
jgi:cell division protein FtsL